MANVVLKIDTAEWDKFLASIKAKGANPFPVLKTAYETIGYKDLMDHFQRQEGPEGQWPPRRAETNRAYDAIAAGRRQPPSGSPRAAYRSSNKLLQLTGNLRQSISPTGAKRLNAHTAVVYANAPYAGAHEEGRQKLPVRSFMWISDNAMEKMAHLILKFMTE
jgi:phage gpG-like protein